ncbi:hypothetical protein B0H11DRAFT_2035758 [Mycena galericulata]|nr:hypothetical protein B0H11DRAFT_2035758 [Mycena galericulata]
MGAACAAFGLRAGACLKFAFSCFSTVICLAARRIWLYSRLGILKRIESVGGYGSLYSLFFIPLLRVLPKCIISLLGFFLVPI